MAGWFKKSPPLSNGPDFGAIDSLAKATELARDGQLQKLLLLPREFGGEDVAPNWVVVPAWAAQKKAETDINVVRPLAAEGKVSRYRATPHYQGKSFIPNAITIHAWDPGAFTMTINIWGDALKKE